MYQSCKWCDRLHPVGYACPKKPQRRRKNTEAQLFRNTYEWRRTRKRVNERDGFLCRICLMRGVLNREDLSTHHIVPLEESLEYATDEDWCITLCDGDHKSADRGEISRDLLHRLALEPLRMPLEDAQKGLGVR